MNSYDYVRQKTSKWNEEKIRANNSESHHYMELKQFEFSRKLLIFFFEISLGAFRSLTYEQTRETNELMWIGLCRAARKLSILFKTRNISRWEFLVCRQGKDISSRGISSDHLSAHAENFSHWQLNKKNEKNKWKKNMATTTTHDHYLYYLGSRKKKFYHQHTTVYTIFPIPPPFFSQVLIFV